MSNALWIKPVSHLKANAAEVLRELAERREPLVITQNGEAKAAPQDVASFEETRETLALLKRLVVGMRDIEAGRARPAHEVADRLRAGVHR
jgi:prevent-host-death family protein